VTSSSLRLAFHFAGGCRGVGDAAGRAAAGGCELAEQPQQQERLVWRTLLFDRCLPEAGQLRQQLVAGQAVAFSSCVKAFQVSAAKAN
jgi:hypothetical protein